ncbi:MAG: hypothetical protein PVG51_07510 [Desulfosarcina sp.]|jgi:hypothetical protein
MSSVSKAFTYCLSCLFSLLLALPTSAAEPENWKRFRFELEGGVDSDDVYNFSWFNYGFLTVGYQF